jgi:hypothetical protein
MIPGHLAVTVSRKFEPLRVSMKPGYGNMSLRKIALYAASLHYLGFADLEHLQQKL